MHNPIRGIVTSEHQDDGGYKHHRGRDIGTRDLNNLLLPVWVYGVGRPVYAAFSGRWKKIHRTAKHGNKASTWAPTRTGNGGLVANPDGEGNGYNHVKILPKWDVGDWINEGELVGHLDLSGTMSAPHLHFEMWLRWQDPYSDYSPKIVFDKYGINTMDDPAPVAIKPAAPDSTSRPSTTTPAPEPLPEPEPTTPYFQEEDMLFIWGRTRGRILSGGVFAGVPHSVIVNAQKVGIPVTALDDAAHASLSASFADRTQKVALDEEKDG